MGVKLEVIGFLLSPDNCCWHLEERISEPDLGRWSQSGWEQTFGLPKEEPFQPASWWQVWEVPDLQAEDPPNKRQILPRLLVQEGHLLHVWNQNPQNQKLQAGLYLKKKTQNT